MDAPSSRIIGPTLVVIAFAAMAVGGYALAPPDSPANQTVDLNPQTPAENRSDGTETWTPTADVARMDRRFSIAENPEVRDPGTLDLERTDVTVLTTQGYYPDDEVADLVAFTSNGTVIYHEAKYGVYFDVDPVRGTKFTVEYLASAHFNGTTCDAVRTNKCTRDVIRRVNLTTGESETVYAEVTPGIHSGRQHDADRINDTHLAVAGIVKDRVFVLDTRTDEVVWEWRAANDYSAESGGPQYDWTHLNDVEVLPDGRLMASLRNQDSVVFLDPSKPADEALQENWTLGEDDNYDILYEQHNADYIPAERGGPAVLVGDSENNRVVEYQRVDGGWERTWSWTRDSLHWPRDADRLPNGNTVVVNTRNDRVVGVGPFDTVRWTVDVGMPYDVERLGTGDESTGGMTADRRADARDSLSPRAVQSSLAGTATGLVAFPVTTASVFGTLLGGALLTCSRRV